MEGSEDKNAKLDKIAENLKQARPKKEQGHHVKTRPHGRPDRGVTKRKRTGRTRSRS